MSEMMRLIRNESMKMLARPGTWVMMGTLSMIGTVFTFLWNAEDLTTPWILVGDQIRFLFFVNTFVIIAAGGILANEYTWGTIKFLLIRPVTRGKIVLSKFLTVILFGLLLLAILWAYSILIYLVVRILNIFGFVPEMTAPKVKKLWFDSLGGVLLLYGLRYIEVVVYGTFAMMLSILSKSSALSTGFSLMTLIFGPELARMIADHGLGRLILFNNLNLTQYLGPLGLTGEFWSAVMVILFYGIVFYMIGWAVFTKRDVFE